MSRHWKERADATHTDHMTAQGGIRREPSDPLVPTWSYFVQVVGFTFEFASTDQLRECLEYCQQKVHPSTRRPVRQHWYHLWHERLPKGLLRGSKRARIVRALENALAEFEPE